MVFYESHGTEKSGFEYTMRHMLVRAKRLKGIDVAKGRSFSTFGAASPSVTAQFEDDEGEVVDYLHSDYDSIIKGFATGMALMNRGVGHTFSTPHVHNINPAENYMRAVKESALAMQALAGLPDMAGPGNNPVQVFAT